MDIAYNIKRLRLQNDMTQEELAARIGCSSKTVSKWECGDGYPDIAFIPVIANVLNVTTDELFGMDEVRKKERMNEYIQRIIATGNHVEADNMVDFQKKQEEAGDARDEIALEALREFAGDLEAEANFAAVLSQKYRNEQIAIYERVLERSTDDRLRNTVRTNLAGLLMQMGETDRAIEIIRALPSAGGSQTWLLPSLTQGRGHEGLRNMRNSIIELYQMLGSLLIMMADARDISGEYIYGDADKAKFYIKHVELYTTMENGELAGPMNLIGFSLNVARYSSKAGLYEQAFEYLEKAAELAEEYAEAYHAPTASLKYSGVILTERAIAPPQHQKHEQIIRTAMTDTVDDYVKFMGLSSPDEVDNESGAFITAFDPIRGHPRFLAVLERVERLAIDNGQLTIDN